MWRTEADKLTNVSQERSASCLTATMITRFNAEYKERPNGKGFSGKERLGIGPASMMGIPYRIAGEWFDISRTHYYDLGKKADCVLENLRASERVIALNKAFRERLVVALTCYGMAAANITAFAEEVFAYSISGGTVWNILLECRIQSAKTYLPTKQEYDLMRQNTPMRLLQSDSLRILYDWLREYTTFSGYGYQDSLELCRWILNEMASLYPKRDNLPRQQSG